MWAPDRSAAEQQLVPQGDGDSSSIPKVTGRWTARLWECLGHPCQGEGTRSVLSNKLFGVSAQSAPKKERAKQCSPT